MRSLLAYTHAEFSQAPYELTPHQLRTLHTSAKEPESFETEVDPLTKEPLASSDLTDKQREDLKRFNAKFPTEPKLRITKKGRFSRKPARKGRKS